MTGAPRRDHAVRGFDLDALHLGARFRIGDALFERIETRDACARMETATASGAARWTAGRGSSPPRCT